MLSEVIHLKRRKIKPTIYPTSLVAFDLLPKCTALKDSNAYPKAARVASSRYRQHAFSYTASGARLP